MQCEFKPVGRWGHVIAMGMLTAVLAMLEPAHAGVIDSSHDKLRVSSAMPTKPSALLNHFLSSESKLNWREPGGSDSAYSSSQIIWPPIDQPLDLRGGYRKKGQAIVSPAIQATNSDPISSPQALSRDDCEAAAAFILAGARARDRGISAQSFMGQLRADLLKLAAEPPATRWFLHTQTEAELLLSAAARIYHEPRAASWHFTNFVQLCDEHRTSR